MERKLFVLMIVVAIMVSIVPTKSASAALPWPWGVKQPATPVVIGDLPWKAKIEYRLDFNIGANITSMEIAPAGTNVWTTVLDVHQKPYVLRLQDWGYSSRYDIFRQDLYGDVDTFDIRINGVVWKNVTLYNDAVISLGYTDQGPIIQSSKLVHNNDYY
jgi:hypothetical protein